MSFLLFLHVTNPALYLEYEFTENAVKVNGKDYPRDNWTNVTPTVLSRMGRNLHLQPKHPISIIRQLIESHFADFKTFNDLSPIVTTRENFDDLLIPKDHPSRSKSDNYYFNESTVLRAHTSAHQLHGMLSGADKFLITGDVYRRDEIDASHYPVFHQMEGLAYFDNDPIKTAAQVQKDITKDKLKEAHNVRVVDDTVITASNPMQERHSPEAVEAVAGHLKYSLNSLARKLFADEPNLEVRWVEAFFPFTSPSWEVEIKYKGEWLEVLGCGVVKQELMDAAGNWRNGRALSWDTEKQSRFAWQDRLGVWSGIRTPCHGPLWYSRYSALLVSRRTFHRTVHAGTNQKVPALFEISSLHQRHFLLATQ